MKKIILIMVFVSACGCLFAQTTTAQKQDNTTGNIVLSKDKYTPAYTSSDTSQTKKKTVGVKNVNTPQMTTSKESTTTTNNTQQATTKETEKKETMIITNKKQDLQTPQK